MPPPSKPAVPQAPSRTRPADFNADAEANIAFESTLIDYLYNTAQHSENEADAALAAAIIANLNSTFLSANAGKAVGINAGGTALEGKDISNLAFANQTEAEAGTNNTKAMSPLRTKQAIDKFASAVSGRKKIATLTANNSASLAFGSSHFDSTMFTDYEFIFDNLLPATDGAEIELHPSDDGGSSRTQVRTGSSWSTSPVDLGSNVGTATDETGLSGVLTVFDLHADKGCMFTFFGTQVNNSGAVSQREIVGLLQRPSADNAVDHIKFQADSGNLASGSVTLFGILS